MVWIGPKHKLTAHQGERVRQRYTEMENHNSCSRPEHIVQQDFDDDNIYDI